VAPLLYHWYVFVPVVVNEIEVVAPWHVAVLTAGCVAIGFGLVFVIVATHPAYVTLKSEEKLNVNEPSTAVEVTVNGNGECGSPLYVPINGAPVLFPLYIESPSQQASIYNWENVTTTLELGLPG